MAQIHDKSGCFLLIVDRVKHLPPSEGDDSVANRDRVIQSFDTQGSKKARKLSCTPIVAIWLLHQLEHDSAREYGEAERSEVKVHFGGSTHYGTYDEPEQSRVEEQGIYKPTPSQSHHQHQLEEAVGGRYLIVLNTVSGLCNRRVHRRTHVQTGGHVDKRGRSQLQNAPPKLGTLRELN